MSVNAVHEATSFLLAFVVTMVLIKFLATALLKQGKNLIQVRVASELVVIHSDVSKFILFFRTKKGLCYLQPIESCNIKSDASFMRWFGASHTRVNAKGRRKHVAESLEGPSHMNAVKTRWSNSGSQSIA